ncbi:PLP-dependent aminotransferase family protein [Paenibacillus sp. GCM10027626]|uniref:MocR-like pyridoxine biosynthesis transcription factor PdxR n=1 Tax=Paenibacillus sp. GCM10027626 TaxID=3273411 RepID=UPI0036262BAF
MDFNPAYERYYKEYGKKAESLYLAIKDQIEGGNLIAGMRLPPTRKLAEMYDLSRGVATEVYEKLSAEGFVKTEAGNGTFVAGRQEEAGNSKMAAAPAGERAQIPLSNWAKRLQYIERLTAPALTRKRDLPLDTRSDQPAAAEQIDFGFAAADAELFPAEEWKKAMYAEIRDSLQDYPRTSHCEGYLPLREAIALGLRQERGIGADASQIVLTNGSMQAITLLAMLLLSPGDDVVLENPTYLGIQRAIFTAGGRIAGAPVDDEGIIPQDWDAKLLLVTPARQFPTGAQLSAERREQLLEWANRKGAVIIEDDYDSTFYWNSRRTSALKAMDCEDRVIYVGTFSKAMLGEQRIGYVLLPQSLVEPFRLAKQVFEPVASGLIEQRALAAFIASGSYERHRRRIQRICGQRLESLQQTLSGRLNRWFRFIPAHAGLHVYAEWRGNSHDYERLKTACQAYGIRWLDSRRYWLAGIEGGRKEGALFSFAHLTEEQIERGAAQIERLASHLQL